MTPRGMVVLDVTLTMVTNDMLLKQGIIPADNMKYFQTAMAIIAMQDGVPLSTSWLSVATIYSQRYDARA